MLRCNRIQILDSVLVPTSIALLKYGTPTPEVTAMLASSTLNVSSRAVQDLFFYGNTSTGILRPPVPVTLCREVFDTLHNAADLSMRATRRLISSRFGWPGVAKQVSTWTCECLSCQLVKTCIDTLTCVQLLFQYLVAVSLTSTWTW